MLRLWNLLTPRPKMRHFALLDSLGVCRALREASQQPTQLGWVEVTSTRPHWLGRTLPVDEIIVRSTRPRHSLQALSA